MPANKDAHASPPSRRELLWSLAYDLRNGSPPSAPSLLNRNPDRAQNAWDAFLHLTDLHTLTPLLFKLYQQEGVLPEIPGSPRQRLQQAYENTLSRATWMWPEVQRLLDALSDSGIEFLVLKGFPLIDQLYRDRGVRPSYDVDFWLRHPGDAERAVNVLLGLGYEPLADESENHAEGHRHLVPYWKPAPRAAPGDYFHPRLPWTVEPHLAFWEEYWWGLRLTGLGSVWERHATLHVNGRGAPVLGSADNLIYLSMHEMLHAIAGNARLFHLHDIHRLCPMLDTATWSEAWDRAEQAGLEQFVAAALVLATAVFGTGLPSEAQSRADHALRGRAVGRWLRTRAADDVLLQDWTAPHSSRYRLAWLSALFARNLWDKPRAFVQPLAKTALPSAQFIRHKYGLRPNQPVAPYYIPHIAGGILGYVRTGLKRRDRKGDNL